MDYQEYLKIDEKIAEEVFNLCSSYVVNEKIKPPIVLATVLNAVLNLIKNIAPTESMANVLITDILSEHNFNVSSKKNDDMIKE